MTLDDALQSLDAQFGVPPPPAEGDGRYYYRLDGTTVGLGPGLPEGYFAARTWVGTVDVADEATLAELARAGLHLPIAPDACLGMDGDGEVYLDQRIGGADLTHELFLDSLERLVGEAQAWKGRLGTDRLDNDRGSRP